MNKVVSLKIKKTRKFFNFRKLKMDIDIYKFAILILGILSLAIGCFAYKISNNEAYNEILNNLIKNFLNNGYYNILKKLLKFEFITIIISLFTSTNILGKYFLFMIPCVKTFLIGFFSSFLYNQYSLNGALFCLIFLYPFYAISVSILIYVINEGYDFSSGLFACVIQNKSTVSKLNIRLYFVRLLICMFFLTVLCIINSYIIYFLSSKIITIL